MNASQALIKPQKKKNAALKCVIRYWQLYIVLGVATTFFFIFSYLPMYGITMAFRDFRFDTGLFWSPWADPWYKYFRNFFNYYKVTEIIRNTLVISSFKLFLAFPMPIIFALMIVNLRDGLFKRIVQSASYLPNFVSWVVVVAILNQFLSLDSGLVNQFRVGLGMDPVFFMNDSDYFYPIMFFSHVWKGIGMGSIIYISALMGIDPELYEAAQIDGANKLRQIWHITLPGIVRTAVVLFIMSLGGILSAGWDQIYLLLQPGNRGLAEILDTYVIQVGLREANFSYATAVSLFQSVIGLMLIVLTNYFSKKFSEISLF